METRFDKQVVIVTGGTGGLGSTVALRFQALGARVVVPFLSEQALQAFAARHGEEAKSILFAHLDVRDGDKVKRFMDRVAESDGPPHAVVNLVGGYESGPVQELELEDVQRLLDLNFVPSFHFCKAVLPHMLGQGRGKIVNVGARAGLAGAAEHLAYAVAKSSVLRLTETLAAEVKHHNINVNCVLPSIIDTAANRRDMAAEDFSHWVNPADLAEVIVFLCSEGARAIHGAAIPVYGRV